MSIMVANLFYRSFNGIIFKNRNHGTIRVFVTKCHSVGHSIVDMILTMANESNHIFSKNDSQLIYNYKIMIS